jgi:hypothetical protein
MDASQEQHQHQTEVVSNPMPSKNPFNTGMLMCICFLYSVADVLLMESADCMVSMQKWLLVSYVNVALFRLAHKIGQKHSNAGKKFIFSFRQPSRILQGVVLSIWVFLVPFFAVWTVLGTFWFCSALNRTDNCTSSLTPTLMVIVWQGLSYLGIMLYGAIFIVSTVIEIRLRTQEQDLRMVETEESVSWWGRLSVDIGESDISIMHKSNAGLKPQQIQQLPEVVMTSCDEASDETLCAICISDFAPGEKVRCLPPCGHRFHKACVDIWLLRQAECPMCKMKVDPECKANYTLDKDVLVEFDRKQD